MQNKCLKKLKYTGKQDKNEKKREEKDAKI